MANKIKEFYKNNKKTSVAWYLALRALVIIVMVLRFLSGDFSSVFLCILTLILFTIPYTINQKFKIEIPDLLEIIILLFIFSAEILGEIQNFYGIFKHWDTILHTINGFLCAAIGFSLIDILNNSEKFHIKLSPIFVALVAFCFSMTIGVLWEFFEYGADTIFKYDMQKDRIVQTISTVVLEPEGKNIPVVVDNIEKTVVYSKNGDDTIETIIDGGYLDIGINDTMKDLMVNFIGAVIFSIIGYFYIQNRDKYKFAENFIPIKKQAD
ncbi:MAG: hypothetical protein ACI4UE_02190 [Candidatus Scatovivens sp.]